MQSVKWLMILALISAAGLQAQAHEKRIAVVNVSRVFNAYQRVNDIQSKMEKLFESERSGIQKDSIELKKWEDKLKVMTQNPKENIEAFKELQRFELAKMELELRFRKLAEEVEKQRKEEMKVVLRDIKTSIAAVGRDDKYDLVLRAPEFDDDFDPTKAGDKEKENEAQSAAELVRKFRENPVLYFSQGVDVTQKVIDRLNGDYKALAPGTK